MEMILDAFATALSLIVSLDPEVVPVILLSLKISCSATLLSLLVGLPFGTVVALADFPAKRLVVSLINTSMGLPPVVVGLFVTLMLWRSGPFGFLDILYTPAAMVIAQSLIATPIVTGITVAAIQALPENLKLQVLALGATRRQMIMILIREARLPLLAAIMAGFGGVISEVGASMMVGGNIRGETRVLTTATVMETSRGNFDMALALSFILLLIAFGITSILTLIQQRERPR